jgi:seryl-tRNA synthetase
MSEEKNGVSRLDEVKVSRKEILEIVKTNKQKHDKILSDAIEGYWLDADKTLKAHKLDRLKELKKQYQKNVKDFKKQINKDLDLVSKRKKDGSFVHLRKAYPEDHSNDFNSVIRKLELCVEDNVELDSNEFEQYVRNRWAWRESFITTNSYYSQISGACSPWANHSVSGSYALTASWSPGILNVGVGNTKPTFSLNVDSKGLDF